MGEPGEPLRPSTTDQILDLLLDALLERQAVHQARRAAGGQGSRGAGEMPPLTPGPSRTGGEGGRGASIPTPGPAPGVTPVVAAQPGPAPVTKPAPVPRPGEKGWTPPPLRPSIHLDRVLRRLIITLAALAVLINIPLTASGTSLARMIPPTSALVIRDGLVLKGSGPEIYVLQDNKLRWISSLDAFHFFGYRWEQVHIVDDEFLAEFEKGRPIHVLLKCEASPHIYALENDRKRWIKDIPTFEAQGYVWSDVRFVSCEYLRRLPNGPPIPEDAGPPPQP